MPNKHSLLVSVLLALLLLSTEVVALAAPTRPLPLPLPLPLAAPAVPRGGAAKASASSSSSWLPSFGSSSRSSAPAQEQHPHQHPGSGARDPLLVRAARGEAVERTPVWIMRQAGRHMASYRELCKSHPTFRERSEDVELSARISLQPVEAYDVDGCILFSDILTPLPAMGVDFDIEEGLGPIIPNGGTRTVARKGVAAATANAGHSSDNWFTSSTSSIDKHLKPIDLRGDNHKVAFVGKTLRRLRAAMAGTDKAVLGFAGLPFTLAAYLIEGGSSKDYKNVKGLMYRRPAVMHHLLRKLADNVAEYVKYQIANGAQMVQLFDSWAGELAAPQYAEFAAHYHKYIIRKIKDVYPDVPIILFVHRGAAPFLESMADTGADAVSVDWTVDVGDVRRRLNTVRFMQRLRQQMEGGEGVKPDREIAIQGNLDPIVLHADKKTIEREAKRVLDATRGGRFHIMNLGHGIDPSTKEENVKHFVNYVRNYKHPPAAAAAAAAAPAARAGPGVAGFGQQ